MNESNDMISNQRSKIFDDIEIHDRSTNISNKAHSGVNLDFDML